MNAPVLNAPAVDQKVKALTKELAEPQGLFIGGAFVPARSGETFDVINPATEEVLASAAAGAAADIDLAIWVARKAFDEGPWRSLPPASAASSCGGWPTPSRRMPKSSRCWNRSTTASPT